MLAYKPIKKIIMKTEEAKKVVLCTQPPPNTRNRVLYKALVTYKNEGRWQPY